MRSAKTKELRAALAGTEAVGAARAVVERAAEAGTEAVGAARAEVERAAEAEQLARGALGAAKEGLSTPVHRWLEQNPELPADRDLFERSCCVCSAVQETEKCLRCRGCKTAAWWQEPRYYSKECQVLARASYC